ncbi:MAG: hypothetical protein MdMp014T_0451 [Treponematales bacterium]
MAKLNRGIFVSPPGIFILYCLASAAAVFGFRLLFPGEAPPLPVFALKWKIVRGAVDYLTLFPALALSALIIPFGFKIQSKEKFAAFSPRFLEMLELPVATAIAAAAVYACLFFLALPAARDYETNLRFEGDLYRLARDRAGEYAAQEAWGDVFRLVAICDRVWPGSPELDGLRTESQARVERFRLGPEAPDEAAAAPVPGRPAALSAPAGQKEPVDAAEALKTAEAALDAKRFYDAHWLATLGGRLARENSPERRTAAALAAKAWDGVMAMEPSAGEQQARDTYRLKRAGYEAMEAQNWVEAYYTFRELAALVPSDPDVSKFLAHSERGLLELAFFTDELDASLGEVQTRAVFSLPTARAGSALKARVQAQAALPAATGRLVMSVASLSVFPDYAYGMGVSLMALDADEKPLWSLESKYAKLIPLSLDGVSRVAVLMQALDRYDSGKNMRPAIVALGGGARRDGFPGETSALLDITWQDFLLLSDLRRGIGQLPPNMLSAAAKNLASCGYLPAVFQAEIIYRFAEAALLLPLAILAIVLGWRYRASRRSRHMIFFMLAFLPAVLNSLVQFYRGCLNSLGILAVTSLGYPAAIAVFTAGGIVLFISSLFLLAGQRG